MVVWCQQAQKAPELSPKVVWVAVSLADRYLSSKEGNKIQEKGHLQLVFITAFYVAVKIHSKNAAKIHHKLEWTAGKFAKYCSGYYSKSDIMSMEEDFILAQNGVPLSCPPRLWIS